MSGIEMERDAESIEKMKKVKREFSATVSKGRIFVAAAQLWPDLLPPAIADSRGGWSKQRLFLPFFLLGNRRCYARELRWLETGASCI